MKTLALICSLIATPVLAQENSYSVALINGTNSVITDIFYGEYDSPGYDDNAMTYGRLRAGETLNFNLDDGSGRCNYGFAAILENGDVIDTGEINICERFAIVFE